MKTHRRTAARVGFAVVAAGLAAAAATAAGRVSIFVVDSPEQRATLVLERSALPGLRLLDSPESLCRRQGPGSPLRSIYLGPAFCHRAVALESMAAGEDIYLRLPFSARLHALASDRADR